MCRASGGAPSARHRMPVGPDVPRFRAAERACPVCELGPRPPWAGFGTDELALVRKFREQTRAPTHDR
eukprot:10463112-Alexandrium_andersonii.AAC.1